jgi:hypothetical protein
MIVLTTGCEDGRERVLREIGWSPASLLQAIDAFLSSGEMILLQSIGVLCFQQTFQK